MNELVRRGLTGVVIALWRTFHKVLTRTSHWLLRKTRHRATIVPARMRANGNFHLIYVSDARLERLHKFYFVWTVCKMCDGPEWRWWHGVAPVPEWLSVVNRRCAGISVCCVLHDTHWAWKTAGRFLFDALKPCWSPRQGPEYMFFISTFSKLRGGDCR